MNVRSQKERMLAGELHTANDPELAADNKRASEWMDRYNSTNTKTQPERQALLEELFASVGPGCNIRPPFYCDYGYNIALGRGVFLNFNCVILDVVKVTIGDLTQIGPGVQILTPDHPRDPGERAKMLEFARPIAIGANVWIGGGALIMPGVTIGDNAIIGSGSVVTRDVPAGATAVGNPARILHKEVDAAREHAANRMGFSAYGITQEGDDPLTKALHGLIDHATSQQRVIDQMVAALERNGIPIGGEAKTAAHAVNPSELNKLVDE